MHSTVERMLKKKNREPSNERKYCCIHRMLKSYSVSEMSDVLARFANLKRKRIDAAHKFSLCYGIAHNEESSTNEYLRVTQINLLTFYTQILFFFCCVTQIAIQFFNVY